MSVPAAQVLPADELVFRALADPTRRALLDDLRQGPKPLGQLAQRFDMTRFGVSKHLGVLREAGLVVLEERGRERWHHLNPVPIRGVYRRWIRSFEVDDADRLLKLRERALAVPGERTMSPTEAPPTGVQNILVEILIEAPRERVWNTMVLETSSWWHEDFYTAPAPGGFHIEARLGGHMFEDWGGGEGQIWGQVVGLRAPEFLQVSGDSSKDWGGPHRSIMTWRLTEEDGSTRLTLEHSIFGHVSPATSASLESGWLTLFRDGLKAFVERS